MVLIRGEPGLSNAKRILSLSAAFAAALNGTMVMPLVVMALNHVDGVSESMATVIASLEIAGIALYCLIAPRLASRTPRTLAIAGVVVLASGEALTHVLNTVPLLCAARLLTGLGEGALFSIITAEIASEKQAERIWGQINVIGGVCMGLLLFGLSALPPVPGRGSIFLWLAGFVLLMAPLILGVGRQRAATHAAVTGNRLPRGQIALILFVVLLVYGVQAGQWAVSGYVGDLAHIPPTRVGLFLAISSVAGFAGAVVPSLTRNPALRLWFVMAGFVVMAVSVYWFFNLIGAAHFLLGQVFVNVGFYMVTPFVTGLLTENDPDGALVLRTLVVALIGAAAGTALAGELLVRSGPAWFSLLAIAAVGAGALGALLVFYRLHLLHGAAGGDESGSLVLPEGHITGTRP